MLRVEVLEKSLLTEHFFGTYLGVIPATIGALSDKKQLKIWMVQLTNNSIIIWVFSFS